MPVCGKIHSVKLLLWRFRGREDTSGLVKGETTATSLDTLFQCGHNNHIVAKKKRVGVRELKTRLGSYLRQVRRDATIVVTDRGEPIAELKPIPKEAGPDEARLAELLALGMVTRKSRKKLGKFEPIRVSGEPLSETVIEGREDRF